MNKYCNSEEDNCLKLGWPGQLLINVAPVGEEDTADRYWNRQGFPDVRSLGVQMWRLIARK